MDTQSVKPAAENEFPEMSEGTGKRRARAKGAAFCGGRGLWILALGFLSGAAGVAHQLVWTRRLVDLFGASAETFAKVVGAFFLGLAIGSWLSIAWGRRLRNPWDGVALAEFAVALLALPLVFSAYAADFARSSEGAWGWMSLIAPIVLAGPPAVAMGLVIPWMIRGAGEGASRSSRGFSVALYGINTLGGVAGILAVMAAGFPRLGLTGTALAVCGVNLLAGLGSLVLRRGEERRLRPAALEREGSDEGGGETEGKLGLTAVWAFGSGFLVLAMEVVAQHQLAQVSINSLFSSATVLAMVLLSLAGAAVLAAMLPARLGSRAVLGWSLLAAAAVCAAQPFLFVGMRNGLRILPYELTAWPYIGEMFKLGLASVMPLFLAAGMVFPLLLRAMGRGEAGGGKGAWKGGGRVGALFFWNGVGGWLGAEATQGWLAPVCGLWGSMWVLGGSYLLLFGLLLRFGFKEERERFWVFGRGRWLLAGGAIGLALAAWLGSSLPMAAVRGRERLIEARVGREGVVATVELASGDRKMLFNNSYTLGGSRAQFNQERQAHVPLLLHGRARSAGIMGVATGSTVAGASLHREIERIEAAELSPIVLEYAKKYFEDFNRGVFRDGRIQFLREDARVVMSRAKNRYDVVVGDLFLPWRTGEARLFTLEHFENVRGSLRDGGLYCQWLPLFQLTRPQFEVILATFQKVFPETLLVRGDFYAELPIVGLVGGRELAGLDWAEIKRACDRLREGGEALDPLVRHAEGVAMLVIGRAPEVSGAALNTLANSWIEWDGGRNILGLKTPWFVGVPYGEYIRDIHRQAREQIPEHLRGAHDAGQFFLTLEVAARLNSPLLAELKAQAPERLPESLKEDAGASWQQWPSRVKAAELGFGLGAVAPAR